MRRMLTTSTSKTHVHRLGRAGTALAAAGLIVTAGACSSDDDDASPVVAATHDRGTDDYCCAGHDSGRDNHVATDDN